MSAGAPTPRWPNSGRRMASAGRFDDMPITSGSVSPQLSSLLIVCSRSKPGPSTAITCTSDEMRSGGKPFPSAASVVS